MDLYSEEKEHALKEGVLSKVFLALSREKNIPKVIKLLLIWNIKSLLKKIFVIHSFISCFLDVRPGIGGERRF